MGLETSATAKGACTSSQVKTLPIGMPIEPGKTVMPIIDTKAVAIEPTNPVHWGVEERIAQRGVERTALQRESEIPTKWTEVLFTSQNFLKTFPPSSGWPGGPAVHLPGEVARPGEKIHDYYS